MRVLIVDDSPEMRTLFTDMLTDLGHEVTAVNDGVEGISVYRHAEVPFDFVLSDYQMPRMNGVIMLMEIRRMEPSQKMALMSADPPRLPEELTGIPVMTKGSIRLNDVIAIITE